jgi:hypothetical protein
VPTKKEKQPLSVTHPELAKEADGWDPSQVTSGSNKKFGWICKVGHRWEAVIASRADLSRNCPYCSNKKILSGFNDLNTLFPDVASEAKGWDPTSIGAGSGSKLSWQCKSGHSWTARVVDRTSKSYRCPFCSGKKTSQGFNDLRTTHPLIADEAIGWDPTLFTAGSNKKFNWKCKSGHEWSAIISDRTSGQGCPFCSGNRVLPGFNDLETTHPNIAAQAFGWNPQELSRGTHQKLEWKCEFGHVFVATVKDRTADMSGCPICSNHQLLVGFNDLKTTHPELSKESIGWDPTTLVAGNRKKVSWQCDLGHIWNASTASRTRLSSGCPVCANLQVLKGFNDLATTHPEIAKEAFLWDPSEVVAGSGDKMKWKCEEGHEWTTRISHRTNSKSSCPSCAISGFDPNESGFLYFLEHSQWEMFQIGITNVPDDRLSKHKRLGWDVLELRGPMDGHLTQKWETAILRMLKSRGADLSNSKIAGKFDGYSEAWSKSTFEAKSIKELMRLTEEFEENV